MTLWFLYVLCVERPELAFDDGGEFKKQNNLQFDRASQTICIQDNFYQRFIKFSLNFSINNFNRGKLFLLTNEQPMKIIISVRHHEVV